MANATASDKQLLSAIEELGSSLRDAEHGYKRAAEDVKDSDLRSRFEQLSRERAKDAEDVDGIIRHLGGTPPSKEGSTSGAAYHIWMDVKSAVTGGDRASILKPVYRSEAYLEACYDKVLKTDLHGMMLPADAVQTIQRQHSSAREARDRSRSMLEAMGIHPTTPGRGMRPVAGGIQNYVVEQPIMGTALAFGVGLMLGALLTMSMQAPPQGSQRAGQGRWRDTGRRYGRSGGGYETDRPGNYGQETVIYEAWY